jgi:hypothetical protein
LLANPGLHSLDSELSIGFIASIIGRSFIAGGGDGADAAAAVSAANNASDVNGVKTTPPITDGMA